jgi:hypothetical protein
MLCCCCKRNRSRAVDTDVVIQPNPKPGADTNQDVEDISVKPDVKESDSKPNVEESDSKPNVEESDNKPHIEESDSKPEVEQVDNKPDVEESNKSEVEQVNNKPAVKDDPSPELTPLEIQKIKSNLDTLMDLNEKIYGENVAIIPEVWGMLKGQTEKNNAPDQKKGPWAEIIVGAIAIAGIATGAAVIEVAAVVVGGVVEYITSDSSTTDVTHINLDQDFSLLSERNTSTYNATNIMIGAMFDDPNKYRDHVFSIPGYMNRTLRDLIDNTIPGKDSQAFQLIVQAQGRQFRNNITIPEMVKMQYWDVYFVQDAAFSGSNFGCCYVPGPPGQPNPPGGIQRAASFNKSNYGNNKRIFSNDEIRHFHPDYVQVNAYGTSDDDLKQSYMDSIASFIHQFPAAYVYPYAVTESNIYSWRWYVMEGYDKIPSPSQNFGVANGEFMKWLFIDDGAGNVVNPDGVGYRYDIFCANNIMRNEHMIPFTANFQHNQETVLVESSDLRYPGKANNGKVYTGDLKQ